MFYWWYQINFHYSCTHLLHLSDTEVLFSLFIRFSPNTILDNGPLPVNISDFCVYCYCLLQWEWHLTKRYLSAEIILNLLKFCTVFRMFLKTNFQTTQLNLCVFIVVSFHQNWHWFCYIVILSNWIFYHLNITYMYDVVLL